MFNSWFALRVFEKYPNLGILTDCRYGSLITVNLTTGVILSININAKMVQ